MPTKGRALLRTGAKRRKDLVFYILDPIHGKGSLLNKIEIYNTGTIYGWQVSPDGSQLALVDHSHKNRIEVLNLSNGGWLETAMEGGWGDN